MAAGLSVDLDRWRREFDELMLRVGARFVRVEPQRRMAAFVRGAGLPRVNCCSIAEYAGDAGTRRMQRLPSAAVWDEAGVRDDLRAYALEHFADPGAVLVVDLADPGTMPRLVQRDAKRPWRGGLLGVAAVAELGIITGFPERSSRSSCPARTSAWP